MSEQKEKRLKHPAREGKKLDLKHSNIYVN